MKRAVVLLLFLAAFSLALCGCRSEKLFDSAEEMVSSMEGTYCASDDHSGEYIIINKENVIKFNINTIFPKDIDKSFFDNFSDEDWGAFNIDVFLKKPCANVSIEAVSADVENSRLSGLLIGKDGTLYGAMGGEGLHPFKKLSSNTAFPTDEIKEKFKDFTQSLKEYEISTIVTNAENIVSEKKTQLDSKLEYAVESSFKYECTASDEIIAECAFESLKSSFRYPASAELLSYSSNPEKDSYGRVLTSIRCKSQNGFGNFITEDYYVLLQSCSNDGMYTYISGSNYVVDDGSNSNIKLAILLRSNDFNQDPNYNAEKDPEYLDAIKLAKNGNYESAVKKLENLKGYRWANSVITACEHYTRSLEYKNAVDLFAGKKYSEAAEKLASLKNVDKDGEEIADFKTERIISLCGYFSGKSEASTS